MVSAALPRVTLLQKQVPSLNLSEHRVHALKIVTLSRIQKLKSYIHSKKIARRVGSVGSMSASGSAGPGFNPRWGSKFSFENFQPRG